MAVELIDVTKSYRDAENSREIFCNVNVSIANNEILAIRGRSGSGKTTLLNLIAGIDSPDSGSIRIDGVSLQEMSEKEKAAYRRDNIGFVFQFFNLLPTLKIIENVSLPAELAKVGQDEAEEIALAMLERVGLSDRADDYPDKLSGGELQRVAIARALIQSPKIVLADEPTGNLDSAMGAQVMELLIEMSRKGGHILILVTHSHQIAAVADRVLMIKNCMLVNDPGLDGKPEGDLL